MSHKLFRVCGLMATLACAADAAAQQYTRVNMTTGGTPSNIAAHGAAFSGDGKLVAFTSFAEDLVADDHNGFDDVFVRDLAAQTTTRISVRSNGVEGVGNSGISARNNTEPLLFGVNVSLNQDGSIIAFASEAQLDPAAAFGGSIKIFVRDRSVNQTTMVSVASDSTQANGDSGDPQISGNGRYVLFTSRGSNLAAGDLNGVEDVFLRDRTTLTTTRISVSPTGGDLAGASYGGRISADGQIIAFVSEGAPVSDPDPTPCLSTGCGRAYIVDRGANTVTRVPIPNLLPFITGLMVRSVAITPDGRFVAVQGDVNTGLVGVLNTALLVYDRQTKRVEVDAISGGRRIQPVTISPNGRFVATGGGFVPNSILPVSPIIFDRQLYAMLTPPDVPPEADASNGGNGLQPALFPSVAFGPNGLTMAFETSTHDASPLFGMFVENRDSDSDGMPDTWETQFGLNPASAADGALDADNDGVTNAQEYANGSNPKGVFKRYFAEGAANSFFTSRFALFNPGDQATVAAVEFLGSNSQTRSSLVSLPAHGWAAITLNAWPGQQPDNDFSTVIESDQPVVADRLMTWDQTGYGSSAETSIEAPATTWYLAEGSTGGSFDLFYLLQNPGDAAAHVTVNYLRPAPAAPIVKTYTVPAKSRQTIYVDTEGPELAATDVSAKITSDVPILAERSMYYSTPTQPFAAGHEGAAVAAPAKSWFLAEGATGSFFDLFLLLANAETTDAQVKVTYLLPSGAPIVKNYTVAPQSRVTINVDFEDARLQDTPVSTIVESTNDVPVIAERAMWWPSPNWYEAHLSAGSTTTGTRWALAEGRVSDIPGSETETYVLIANTSNAAGTADVTLFFPDGTSKTKTFAINANSRTNVAVSVEFPEALNKAGFGTIIQSSGPQIVVERAIYSNANFQTWAAGSDALGTKLQ